MKYLILFSIILVNLKGFGQKTDSFWLAKPVHTESTIKKESKKDTSGISFPMPGNGQSRLISLTADGTLIQDNMVIEHGWIRYWKEEAYWDGRPVNQDVPPNAVITYRLLEMKEKAIAVYRLVYEEKKYGEANNTEAIGLREKEDTTLDQIFRAKGYGLDHIFGPVHQVKKLIKILVNGKEFPLNKKFEFIKEEEIVQ
jgi:hypothetical protein